MMWDGHEGMGWWMVVGSIWFVLFWGVLIWAVVTVATKLGEKSSTPGHEDSALEIARRRYARGEITKDEFEQLKKDLAGRD